MNIAAISYIGRKVEKPRLVAAAGLLYTLGCCSLYVALAVLLTATAASIPAASLLLQNYMHGAIGADFLLLGMFLTGLITFSSGGTLVSEGVRKESRCDGLRGRLLVLGVLFALSRFDLGRSFSDF